ncbi:MAG: glycosyltransferase family 39 protein [Cyclobacteriaceae bacterium]
MNNGHITRFHLYFLFILWLIVHGVLYFYSGIRTDLFDAKGYIKGADFLLMTGRLEVFHQIFYAVPILLIAFFRWVHAEGVHGFVLFQCILSGVAAFSLYHASSRVFKDQNAGLFSAVIFLCWWDVIQWNTAVMTESVACSVICLVTFKLTYFRDTFRDYALLTLLLALCVLTRPTGVLIIFGSFTFLITRHWAVISRRPFLKVLILVCFGITAFWGAVSMFNYWDFTEQYLKGNIVTYMDTIEGQPLYKDNLRLDTSDLLFPDPEKSPAGKMLFFAWNNPVHFAASAFLKVFYLITGTRPYFSTLHNTYTIVWTLIIFSLFYFGFRYTSDVAIKNFSVAVIVANCSLVALSTVDWDNRFYMPMQPGIALLAGGGGAYCFRHLKIPFLQKTKR